VFYGRTDYFQAPPSFLGDLSRYESGEITYDIRSKLASDPFEAPLALIRAKGVLYRHDGPGVASTDWQTMRIPLNAASWTRITPAGPVDVNAFRAALSSVEGLWLRGEFSDLADGAWFDNPTLSR